MNTKSGFMCFLLGLWAVLLAAATVWIGRDLAEQQRVLAQKARTTESLLRKDERQLQQEPADELLQQVTLLRERLAEGAKLAIPVEQVSRMIEQWRTDWEVTEQETQEAPLGSRRVLALAAVPRSVAEWPLLARAVEEASRQPGVHLTHLQVLASGEADRRKLERVEFTLVVHQRAEGPDETKGAL